MASTDRVSARNIRRSLRGDPCPTSSRTARMLMSNVEHFGRVRSSNGFLMNIRNSISIETFGSCVEQPSLITSGRMDELFPDLLDLNCPGPAGDGCAKPIGRRMEAPRRRVPLRPPRPSTAALLSELRALMRAEFGSVVLSLRRIERHAGDQAGRRADDSEILANLLRRMTGIERTLALIEQPSAPRVSRRRPLD